MILSSLHLKSYFLYLDIAFQWETVYYHATVQKDKALCSSLFKNMMDNIGNIMAIGTMVPSCDMAMAGRCHGDFTYKKCKWGK